MSETKMIDPLKSEDLWLKIINEGVEDRVEVNQRMLIDKMLARYSSDFVIYRELIQNSDDAQSTSFTLEITCDPSTSTFNYQSINKINSTNNTKQRNQILEGIGQLFKNPWGLNSPTTTNENELIDSSKISFEENLNNCIINEIRTTNNGNIFNEDDWKRVITIAEGNTNVDAIGQFGVGFFSVFSYSEKPIIQSGKHCLAFVWQNGKSLTTFRKELSEEQQTLTTSVILSMKNKFILQTKNNFQRNNLIDQNRTTRAKKNTTTNEIVPTLDLTQLKAYFTKVLSFTKYIQQLIIQINGKNIFQVNKTTKPIESTKLLLAPKEFNTNNEHQLLKFNSFKQTEQIFSIENGPSITLFHIDVQANVTIDQQFQIQIEKVLKKSLPPTINIQFLFPSNDIFEEEQWNHLSNQNLNNQMLKELIPLKFDDGQINPSGQIFIGLATHQTTGIGMHVFTHLIPTIERENIDLQDPYISIWNEQLLTSIGKIIRFIYDQTILNAINNIQHQTNQIIKHFLSPYAFQTSAPNKDIGRLIADGFFSLEKDILVPVKRNPSDVHLSLIPSSEAYLSNSKHIQTFLPVPIVPFEIGKNEFFKILKRREWIEEITNEIILNKINETILSFDEFIGLLRWLCTNDINNKKSFIKQILSKIRYRENRQSEIIKLEKLEYFDTLNIPCLPLPSNVLSSNIVSHISREDLQRHLSLSSISVKSLIEFYLDKNQHHLFLNSNTTKILLNFLSARWNQFNSSEINQIKDSLSNLKCIPTTNGMKIPNDSYIKSSNFSLDLSIIKLNIPEIVQEELNEYPISIEFLKSIGCRTIYVPTLTNKQTNISSEDFQTNENFILNLLEQRKSLSHNDIQALKINQCILGKTFDSNDLNRKKCKPNELHFPDVGERLQWKDLLILDWINLQKNSREYLFLKELGVKEVPDLNKLILRIVEEHQINSKYKIDYQLPKALLFFSENFQEYYSKLWKNLNNQIPFLPSSLPDSDQVILTIPQLVFKELNPLFPSLLPDVIRCFSLYIDINLIGVKPRPQLSMAFNHLMERRNELLTIQTASIYFSYLNKLDGLNKRFIQNVSTVSFIPLKASFKKDFYYAKPNEVFISSKSNENKDSTRDLIDYIDYGDHANSFLITCGVLSYPSAENLANLLIDRQEYYFKQTKDENEEILLNKLNIYTNYLKQLSISLNLTNQLNNEPLKSRLKNSKWCLAYQYYQQTNDLKQRIFKIVKPSDIYLDDDHQSNIDINPLSKWLSENVQRTLIHKGRTFTTERTKKLFHLINHRLDMLFVNNRGQRLENIDEKRFQLLKNSFSVYESEGIECQIHFQNQILSLNSNECSSCALEFDKKKVILYIQKDLLTLDYIDISTELTRFVYKKAHDTLVHSISDKLSSTLETLKRRGIPVDRLLKIQQQQQQPINLTLQIEENKQEDNIQQRALPLPSREQHQLTQQRDVVEEEEQRSKRSDQELKGERKNKVEEFGENVESARGFFQSLKDLLIPFSPPVNNPIENLRSEVEIDRVKNFGEKKSFDDNDINRLISSCRPYSQRELNQVESSKHEINNSCEFIPKSNLIRYKELLHGIQLFIDTDLILTDTIIEHGKQLSYFLSRLSEQVFNLPIQTMHLFRDIDSARIAFNSNGSLFFNLRYFEQVFSDDLKISIENGSLLSSSSNSIIRRIINFYYMVTCHELSHNIHSNHDLNFINQLEIVSVKFMDNKDQFISKFSF